MKTLTLALVAACLVLAGCVNVPMDVTDSGRESVIAPTDRDSRVRLTVKLATLEDPVKQMGSTFRMQSGKVFRQVFTGDESAPAMLDIVNSTMSYGMNDVMILATKGRVSYSASVVLTARGRKHVLSSSYTAETFWTIDRAAREAIERVVIDLSRQAAVILAES